MSELRISTILETTGGIRPIAERATEFEGAGVDILWVGEAYGFDAPTLLGHLSAVTRRVELGFGILPVFSRTPALVAMTAAGLDAVSDGRAILGLGTSGPQVIEGWHGLPFDRPLGRTRETIDICRAVWARREPLAYGGEVFAVPRPDGAGKALKLAARPIRDRIPIWIASLGPANVALTAERADGWLPVFYVPEKSAAAFGEALSEGLANRDPALGPLEIAGGGPFAITDDPAEVARLRDRGRRHLAFYVGGMGSRKRNYYHSLMCRYGWEAAADTIQSHYLEGRRAEAEAAVPDELLEKTSLIGPEGYLKDRLAAHREAGVTVIDITPVGPDGPGDVARLKELTV